MGQLDATQRVPFRFRLDPHTGVPVYRQIIDQVQAGIATRALRPGDQLPTVRQVAVDLAINKVLALAGRDEPRDFVDILYIDERAAEKQLARLERLRRTRDNDRVRRSLDALRAAARSERENLMPPILEAVRAYATVGEMCDALREVWGEYEEVPIV